MRAIIVGPAHHGAVQHARTVAALTGTPTVERRDPGSVAHADVAGARMLHCHYTDKWWGPDADSAADAFVSFAGSVGRPIVVSAHDVPVGDGTDHDRRRSRAYRRVLATAAVVIVASEHERIRLHGLGLDADVVPLPVVAPGAPPARREPWGGTIVVLGFVYPGKGHDDVVAAAARLRRPSSVICAGAPSPGHDDLAAELGARAGGSLLLTGPLTDDELALVTARAAVPVVPARNPSASASLARWLAAGRRPLVAISAYSCEIAAQDPRLLTLYDPSDPDALLVAIQHAQRDPAGTWRGGPVPAALTAPRVAAAHRAVFARVLACTAS